MSLIQIEALKYLRKNIEFSYLEDNVESFYKGYVDAVVIEADENHKICIKFDENKSEFFEVDQMFKIKYD